MSIHCLLMFSGGLDSTIAAYLLKKQGIVVTALHFVLPFYSGLGSTHQAIRQFATALDIPLRIEEEGEDFLAMIREPSFGFGKNANPCLDCRIHRLKKARIIMESIGADFIATGEVVGQRPKSQRLDCLQTIDRETGLTGRLLRPLSAQLLAPTLVEEQGHVDRDKLFGINGRGRYVQLAYAMLHKLQYKPPAGGCMLTHEGSGVRFHELCRTIPHFTLEDFKLIAYGRHFPFGKLGRLVVARNDEENEVLEQFFTTENYRIDLVAIPGPLGLASGELSPTDLQTAAAIVARYSRARTATTALVAVARRGEEEQVITVTPASESFCSALRI